MVSIIKNKWEVTRIDMPEGQRIDVKGNIDITAIERMLEWLPEGTDLTKGWSKEMLIVGRKILPSIIVARSYEDEITEEVIKQLDMETFLLLFNNLLAPLLGIEAKKKLESSQGMVAASVMTESNTENADWVAGSVEVQ